MYELGSSIRLCFNKRTTKNFTYLKLFLPQKVQKFTTFIERNFKMLFLYPFWPLTALRIVSLKAASTLLLLLLIKSNLLRVKGGLIGGLVALTLISGLVVSTTVAGGAAYYVFKNKKSNEDDVINADAVSD